jgi:probable phosphoglycerate mutase
MTTFFLVRHAAHDLVESVLAGREIDIALNAHGLRQADALAAELAGEPVRRVLASPRRRALQTAERIAAAHRLGVTVARQIDEHDCGLWAGARFADLRRDPRWRLWNERRAEVRPPAGESMRELQVRAVSCLDRLAAEAPDDTIVLVSHAEPIRAILLHERGMPLSDYLQVDVPVASVTRVSRASASNRATEHA